MSQTTCKKQATKTFTNPCACRQKNKIFFLGHDCTPPLFIFDMFCTPPFRGLIRAINQSEKLLNPKHKSFRPALHLDNNPSLYQKTLKVDKIESQSWQITLSLFSTNYQITYLLVKRNIIRCYKIIYQAKYFRYPKIFSTVLNRITALYY